MASGWRPGERQQGTKKLQVINDNQLQEGSQPGIKGVNTHSVGVDSEGVLGGGDGHTGQEGEVRGSKGLLISETKSGSECTESTEVKEGDAEVIMQEGTSTLSVEDNIAPIQAPAAYLLMDRGKDKLDNKAHPVPRVPLAECTNYLGVDMDVNGGEQSRGNKGHWKRRARLKGPEHSAILGNQEQIGEVGDMKRVRAAGKENTDEDMDLLSNKKWKMTSDHDLVLQSEVEETSRDWSQLCK